MTHPSSVLQISWPKAVDIIEVGPRDGLQNEPNSITTADKVEFIRLLLEAGLKTVELTSFVHPQRVPQLADAMAVIAQVQQFLPTTFPDATGLALVPNVKGMERAIEANIKEAGVRRVAVFTAASDTFTQKNINMTIAESLKAFEPVLALAKQHGMGVRGYVSTCFVCPYQGDIKPEAVLEVTQALLDLGVDEVSLGDTIGAASPQDVLKTVGYLLEKLTGNMAGFSEKMLALHFHDTYGTALANVLAGLQLGITRFDSSAGGLGGCPYAPGASGNLATEDLVYMLERMGIQTGVDLSRLAKASVFMESILGKPSPSKQLQRLKQVLTPNACAF